MRTVVPYPHHSPTNNDLFTMHTTYILKYMTESYQLHEAVTIHGLRACSVIKDLSKQFREGWGGEVEMLKR